MSRSNILSLYSFFSAKGSFGGAAAVAVEEVGTEAVATTALCLRTPFCPRAGGFKPRECSIVDGKVWKMGWVPSLYDPTTACFGPSLDQRCTKLITEKMKVSKQGLQEEGFCDANAGCTNYPQILGWIL
jgi:hypothetical protein